MNKLRDTIETALKDVHIETGRDDEFEKVVNKLEMDISKAILNVDINPYDEMKKDFSNYELFE